VCARGVSHTSRSSFQRTERPEEVLDALRLENDPLEVEDTEPVGDGVL